MSDRLRILLIGAVVLFLGIEIAVRWSGATKTRVDIVNKGDSVMEDLVVSLEESQVAVGTVAPGATTRVWLSGKGKAALTLAFKQAGNPVSGFIVDDFDPRLMRRDGLKMVLEVRPNEVQKNTEEDESATGSRGPRDWLLDWIWTELWARSQKGKPVELTWKAGSAVESPPSGARPNPAPPPTERSF
jgi:hypothetical protein